MATRLVVMISGKGSNAMALVDALRLRRGEPFVDVVAIGADTDAPGLLGASERAIPTFVVEPRPAESREAWANRLAEEIDMFRPDYIVLSGFMKLLPPTFVARYSPRIINTHPSYLPEFPGAHAVRDALRAGVGRTGASVIVVDDGVDTGPLLAQRRVEVVQGDTEESLHERIKVVERELLLEVVCALAREEPVVDQGNGESR